MRCAYSGASLVLLARGHSLRLKLPHLNLGSIRSAPSIDSAARAKGTGGRFTELYKFEVDMDGEETWAAENKGGTNGKGFVSGSTNAMNHMTTGGTRYQAVVADDGDVFPTKVGMSFYSSTTASRTERYALHNMCYFCPEGLVFVFLRPNVPYQVHACSC